LSEHVSQYKPSSLLPAYGTEAQNSYVKNAMTNAHKLVTKKSLDRQELQQLQNALRTLNDPRYKRYLDANADLREFLGYAARRAVYDEVVQRISVLNQH
jgi:hypothetical protein